MTEIQKTNAAAKAEFDKGRHLLAFQTLWETGSATSFVSYAQREEGSKTNWFTDSRSSSFFWNDFLSDEKIFLSIFTSDTADHLLHLYFSRYKKAVQPLEIRLAKEFPALFVNAIRVNQVFLQPDRIDNLLTISLDAEFQIHQKIWGKLYEVETQQWQAIQSELQPVLQLPLAETLSHCIIWLEINRFQNSDQRKLNHLASVYSFFIELVLRNESCKENGLRNVDDFIPYFIKSLPPGCDDAKFTKTSPVSGLLEKISAWIDFKEFIIPLYSFDLNIEPKQENGLLLLASTPEAYYKWLLNGVRYQLNQLIYVLNAYQFIDVLEKSGEIKIPGKNENDIQLNRNLAVSKHAALTQLGDLCIETIQLGKTKVEAEKILDLLITFSFNRQVRYENKLQQLFHSFPSWSEAFIKLSAHSINTDIRLDPYFLMSETEYKELNKKALPNVPEDSTEEVLKLFGYHANKKPVFNRFKYNYDVWLKPFMRIGDFLFCPMLFFANNNWFYTFAQAALFQPTKRSETEKMEGYVGKLFEEKGWKIKVTSDKEANTMNGDIDIFIEDDSALLFIQLKRTYLRLDLKDAYYETCIMDAKASRQLNDAEEYLSTANDIYNVTQEPHKWIVSTSFENMGEKINGCHKINYFELLHALRNPEIKTLRDFIHEMETDKSIKAFTPMPFQENVPDEVKEVISDILKPLAIFDSNKYRIPLLADDEKETFHYNTLFDDAIKLDNEGKKNEALVLLQECSSLHPNDGDAHGAIANILTDMGIYDAAFIAFDDALKALPNDPYITRNYSIALIESGRWYDGLSKVLDLYEKFPMLGDVKVLFEKNFEYCLRLGVLTSDQLVELETKWSRLND
ncbi:MAG: tetratricopeptide repeat protein [Flavobacteriales bacterium]